MMDKLDLMMRRQSEAQKKYFVPIVIGVSVFSIITSKFVTPFIMKRDVLLLPSKKNCC